MKMEDLSLCRTCLNQSSLNPIFVDSIDHTEYSNAIFVTTGLKVGVRDGLPQQMCTNCVQVLKDCLKFRKICKDSEMYLLSMKQGIKLNKKAIGLGNAVTEKVEDSDEDDKPLKHFVDVSVSMFDFGSRDVFHIEKNIQDVKIQECRGDTIKSTSSRLTESHKVEVTNSKPEIVSTDLLYEFVDTDKKRVICKLCQKKLSIRSIDSHIVRHHPGADSRRVKCELCDTYLTRAKLNRHTLLKHKGRAKAFACMYCNLDFDKKDTLIAHAASCSQKKKKRKPSERGRQPARCPQCARALQRGSLRAHLRVQHQGLRPVCEHCGLRLSSARRLAEHARARHGRERLRCARCDFRCASLPALANHERRHRGERPFVCEACGARFHAAALLAQHRHSHRPRKLVQCPQCPATFKAASGLHSHRLSVHGAALFRCGQCGRQYRARHYAVRHLRRVHRYSGDAPPITKETNVVTN